MKPSPHITWSVEMRGVTLFSRDGSICYSITYPYAGIWALIANGNYSLQRATELMSILMSVDMQKAEEETMKTLATWLDAGILLEK